MCFRRFRDFKEWRDFVRSIVAGIFGGLVVALWQLSYNLLENESLSKRIILPLLTTLIFFVLLILFLKWLFLKNDTLQSEIIAFVQTPKNKEFKYNKNILLLWKGVGENEYLSRRNEWNSVDSKLSYLLMVVLAVFALYIQYISFDQLNNNAQKLFYVLAEVTFFISIILSIYGLFPKNLNTINFKSNSKNNYIDEIRVLTKQYEISIENQSKEINKKLALFKASSLLFFIGLFITFLIKTGAIK